MALPLWLKLLAIAVSLGAIVYLAACIAVAIFQNRLIFRPSPPISATPADLGLTYEDVRLPVLDASGRIGQLHGWWVPSRRPDSRLSPDSGDRVLLYLHGNSGTMASNLSGIERFYQAGFSVLAIDYRGYGQSKGAFPSEAEVYRDAQAAWDYLVDVRGIPSEAIVIYGHSLGGAIAIDLAVRKPKAAGVIVENTFTSMKAMADREPLYRWLPIDLLLHQRFDSLGKLPLLKIPLLVINGTHDLSVPVSMGRQLYQAATVPKLYLSVNGAGHNNATAVAGDRFFEAIADFKALTQPRRLRSK